MSGPIFIARQDTLEEIQRDTQGILADTEDIQKKSERVLKSPKGLQVFIPTRNTTTCVVCSLSINTDQCEFAEAGGKVHIFGNRITDARKHYIFDPETGKLEQQENLPYNFYEYGMALGTEDGRVHLFGGSGGARKHWIWDNGSWTEGADLPYDFAHGCAVADGSDIFFICGGTKVLYKWTKSTNTNEYKGSLSNMTCNFYDGFLLIANNRLYFGGGYDTENGKNMSDVWRTTSLTSLGVYVIDSCPAYFRRGYGATSEWGYIYKNFLCWRKGDVYTINPSNIWTSTNVAPRDYASAKPASQSWRYVKDERSFLFYMYAVHMMNTGWSLFLPKGAAILCGTYYYCPMLRKKDDAYIVDETGIVKIGTNGNNFLTDNGMANDDRSITFYIDGEETT